MSDIDIEQLGGELIMIGGGFLLLGIQKFRGGGGERPAKIIKSSAPPLLLTKILNDLIAIKHNLSNRVNNSMLGHQVLIDLLIKLLTNMVRPIFIFNCELITVSIS